MTAQTSFVTCIEAGFLESMVTMLAESLRASDHSLSDSPFYAIRPRPGPELRRSTLERLESLNVLYIHENLAKSYAHFGTFNKCAAVRLADTMAKTEYLTWLDGDTVIVRSPDDLLPYGNFDFRAMPSEPDLSTNGADEHTPYWVAAGDVTGFDYRETEIIPAGIDGAMVHEYYQGGVFSFRRGIGFSEVYHDTMIKLIDSRIGSYSTGIFHNDQIAVTIAAAKRAPRRQLLTRRSNWPIQAFYPHDDLAEAFSGADILHYHGSFFEGGLDRDSPCFELLPDSARLLLQRYVPFRINLSPVNRIHRKLLSLTRNRKYRMTESSAKLF